MWDDLFNRERQTPRYQVPIHERVANNVVRGLKRGLINLVFGVITIGILVVFGMSAARDRAEERAEEVSAAQREESRSNYSAPPSRYDGWGEDALDAAR